MSQKIGMNGLKKQLKTMEQKELIQLICDMYKENKYIAAYLESKYNGQQFNHELVTQYRKKIYQTLDYTRGSFSVQQAKTYVKEFCNIVNDIESQADIYFLFIDETVDLTDTFGDFDEQFYNTVIKMFWEYVNLLNQLDQSYVQLHLYQIDTMMSKTQDIGWGFEEGMFDAYANIEGIDKD